MNFQKPLIVDKQVYIKKTISRNNSPIYIETTVPQSKSLSTLSNEEKFFLFFEKIKSITKINNPRESLKISSIQTDLLGITHIIADQYYKGIKILNSESSLHINSQKERFLGKLYAINQEIDINPVFSSNDILLKVIQDVKEITVYKELTNKEKEILKYDTPSCSLIIYTQNKDQYILAYEIEIRPNFLERWRYFIDAKTSEIIRKYNITQSDGPTTATALDLNGVLRTINTYLEAGQYELINASEVMFNPLKPEGIIATFDANNTSTIDLDYKTITSTDNTWNSPTAVSAHYNATTTYKYFLNKFGRNSINGQGGNIISLINVTEDDGSSMENAFWNGQAAFYGNGGTYFKPLAGALDVTAHELGHGVVSNSANLEYYGQSGAINETYADIFGAMVDRDDWLIGEDITKTTFSPSGALRNMSDPHNLGTSFDDYWQPKHVSEMYIGDDDNGGVHINSGIGNYAYYLYATDVTKEKAEQVFYRALTTYLKSSSQFIDFRIAVIQSAKDLYGESSIESIKAANAFENVGIYEEDQINYAQDYDINPGADFLLSYDTNVSDPTTLYKSSTSGSDFVALTTTAMKGKVSVTDDGSVAVFVSTDNKLRALSLDPLNPGEYILSNEAFWDNIAISKDGNRLAAISTQIDTAIYVYDLISEKWAKFHLYNPTTSNSNTNAGGVLFADAIEFDNSGEFLIYDAYNVLNSTTSEDIYYWDIGFINVWDNSINNFGTGKINKLYGSLPEDVSIGNPVFSKNSPYIIGFDYFDSFNSVYAILGTNILTGDLEIITTNSILGYPSYSKNDDKLTYSALNTSDEEIVAVINLGLNKISSSGSPSVLINDAKWPVYYATGIRALGLEPVSNFTADVKTGNTPLEVHFIDLSINEPSSWSWTFIGGIPSSSTDQNPIVTYNSPGTYTVTLTTTNSFGNNTKSKISYITVSLPTGIDDLDKTDVKFYPNPVVTFLNILCDSEFSTKIFSTQGSLILENKNLKQIDLSILKPGLYILEIKTNSKIIRKKIIKD
ncbi:MAG: M4 family metallopeptidase [Ignavibacteriaceae bacterium]|nr:M4 family metallopeptidase [Ignavibacteriaceae bacterium]